MEQVLQEDWSDYEARKQVYEDPNYFNCYENWETDFLIGKVKGAYPKLPPLQIESAVNSCARILGGPYPRKAFIACVMRRLKPYSDCSCSAPGDN